MTLARLIEAVDRGEWDHDAAAAWLWAKPGQIYGWAKDAFHGSLDAAKRLHDALLPGWRVVVRQRRDDEGGDWFVRVESADFHAVQWTAGDNTRTDILSGEDAVGIAPQAARAWLLAILRAMEGRG